MQVSSLNSMITKTKNKTNCEFVALNSKTGKDSIKVNNRANDFHQKEKASSACQFSGATLDLTGNG